MKEGSILRSIVVAAMIFILQAVFFVASAQSAGVIKLPKTGQTTSYYAGDDGDIEAGVGMAAGRFVASAGIVTDNLTGLQWAQTGNLGGAQTWANAMAYVNNLNSTSYLGHNDWRMPNNRELESLIDYGASDYATSLNSQGFLNVQSDKYWTSTSYALDPSGNWFTKLSVPGRNYDWDPTALYLMPVRGGQTNSVDPGFLANIPKTGDKGCVYGTPGSWSFSNPCANNSIPGQDGQLLMGVAWPTNGNSPDGRFTVGAGAMLDNLTGLMWDGDAHSTDALTWTQALDAVANYNATNYLGYNDWRLANILEMSSLINADAATFSVPKGYVQYLMDQGFTGWGAAWGWHWSSTAADATNAVQIIMGDDRRKSAAMTGTGAWMAVRDSGISACIDGVDNDSDGLTDFPADPGCTSALDNDEVDPACIDGVDNDSDGLTDFPADPGCTSATDNDEVNPACNDSLDNDSDGLTDFPDDPGCVALSDNNELDSANNPPTAPQLVSPVDNASGVNPAMAELKWLPSTDPDGDVVVYNIFVCEDLNFTIGCTTSTVFASLSPDNIMYAGFFINDKVLLLMIILTILVTFIMRKRKTILPAIILISVLLLTSCGDTLNEKRLLGLISGSTNVEFAVTGLSAGTTYYWKIVANDGNGGQTSSSVWSFDTL